MRLRVLGPYRAGAVRYQPGQELDVPDAAGEYLLRDSPGTFALEGALADSVTITESGVATLDRRGRGGQRRTRAVQPEAITGAAEAGGEEE